MPGGDSAELARLRPVVTARRDLLLAHGAELIAGGFPVLPALARPHWTVVLAEPTPEVFAAVRSHFEGPVDNPAWAGKPPPAR